MKIHIICQRAASAYNRRLQWLSAALATVLVCAMPIECLAQAQDRGMWHPAAHRVTTLAGTYALSFSDTPQHLAIGIIIGPSETSNARISAGAATFDGPFISGVSDLTIEQLSLQSGEALIRGVSGEKGITVCVNLPSGTEARVMSKGEVITITRSSVLILDGKTVIRNPRVCSAHLLLQQAFAGAGLSN